MGYALRPVTMINDGYNRCINYTDISIQITGHVAKGCNLEPFSFKYFEQCLN